MTELYHPEQQQTELSEPSSLLTQTDMPSFYSSPRHRALITSHVTEHDDDYDPNAIYKDALILQIFQHWKIKTLEHQQAINNAKNLEKSNEHSDTVPPVESHPPETSSNNTEPEKPVTTMQKRVTPVPASYLRRKQSLKKCISSPSEFIDPNFLAPCAKTRSRTISTATPSSSTSPKRIQKQGPIFIAPKKTSPSPIPRSHSLFSFDESVQMKRKENMERQCTSPDDRNAVPISPSWTPAPPTCTRFFVQSPGSPLDDDDETSSDDGAGYESLLIRNKNPLRRLVKPQQKYQLSPNIIIPTALYITDPDGNAHLCDLNNDLPDELNDSPRIIENDNIPMKSKGELSSSSDSDKYALHIIGEEDEESFEKNTNNGKILSKELNRIEAFKRSRQTNLTAEHKDTNGNPNEPNGNLLGRRWSDGLVSDDDQARSPRLVKMSSATSVVKQTATPPPKMSKAKYFLMKLHLTSSSKDDDSNVSTANLPPHPPKRTVRRSSNKKRYQTQ